MARIKVQETELRLLNLRTRMPFRYGIATMTHVPLAFVRVTVEVQGRSFTGIASDCLPPKWFTKIPSRDPVEEIVEMKEVILKAMRLAEHGEAESVFECWWALEEAQRAWSGARHLPPLLAQFGVSLVERALLEAYGRFTGLPFHQALRQNHYEIDLSRLHPTLAGTAPADFLPARPLEKIILRHTVGLSDPLTDADIPDAERLTDGLPQSLEACLHFYDLRHLKIKVAGRTEQDGPRLESIAELLQRAAPGNFAFSLDGNEQFHSMTEFREFCEELQRRKAIASLFPHLLFVEQPLHRDAALEDAVKPALEAWPAHPPMIIDESGATAADLRRALDLGYHGTSHKNCKGVFKGIANACLLEQRRRTLPGVPQILSGEDLCNIGPVALLQDFAVMAALGIRSVERNGHHYHAGLSQLPPAMQQAMLESHPELYARSEHGWPTLRVKEGEIDMTGVNRAPFGVGVSVDLSGLERADGV